MAETKQAAQQPKSWMIRGPVWQQTAGSMQFQAIYELAGRFADFGPDLIFHVASEVGKDVKVQAAQAEHQALLDRCRSHQEAAKKAESRLREISALLQEPAFAQRDDFIEESGRLGSDRAVQETAARSNRVALEALAGHMKMARRTLIAATMACIQKTLAQMHADLLRTRNEQMEHLAALVQVELDELAKTAGWEKTIAAAIPMQILPQALPIHLGPEDQEYTPASLPS